MAADSKHRLMKVTDGQHFEALSTKILPTTIDVMTTGLQSVRGFASYIKYEGWNFNFGNTPLDWIQELLE